MNTLMDDSDLKPAYEQARRYYEMGADALIIQDLGLGRILKKYLPDMPLHLSTQAGVCNGQGVSAAAPAWVRESSTGKRNRRTGNKEGGRKKRRDRSLRPRGPMYMLFGAVSAEQVDRRTIGQQGHLRSAVQTSI